MPYGKISKASLLVLSSGQLWVLYLKRNHVMKIFADFIIPPLESSIKKEKCMRAFLYKSCIPSTQEHGHCVHAKTTPIPFFMSISKTAMKSWLENDDFRVLLKFPSKLTSILIFNKISSYQNRHYTPCSFTL